MVIEGILILLTVVGPGLSFIPPKSNEIKPKNESCLCNRILVRAKLESWRLKKLLPVRPVSPRNLLEKSFDF